MASTWSALKVELLETGANSGTWGTLTNVNLGNDVLGEAITGSATVNYSTAADVTLTLTDSATSQSARNLRLNITESGAGVGYVGNLILGSGCQIEKFYLIRNNGTGAKTVKNTSGTGVAVPAGKATLVYNDGTNVVDVLNSFSSAILGAENAGSIIPFYFANQAAFPSASTYHGAIAHSHADGAMYFAHSGSWVRMLDADTDVTVAQGGTGLSTLTANNVILGNGTSTPLFVAPGSNGNVLTSNGTTWSSTAPATSGTVTAVSVASTNGFAGSSSGGATPALTLSTSITGVLKGNGTAISAGTAGTDYVAPTTATNFTATQTFTGSSSATAIVLNDAAEVATVSATAATGTINYDITTQSVVYYTSNASANWTVNFRASSGTSLNTLMTTGQSMTVAFLVTQGSTAYYNSAVQVDGTTSGVTTRWLGGAPTAGNASGIDSYRYILIKTGSATFTVLASNTQFKA